MRWIVSLKKRWIVSLKKPMNDREFATGQSAKECGKITNWKTNKKNEKNQRNTEDPPQICLQIYGQKSEENPKTPKPQNPMWIISLLD